MKVLIHFLLFFILIFSVESEIVAQDSSLREDFITIKNELSVAVDSSDVKEIARLAYDIERRFLDDDSLKAFAHYYAGYAWYRVYTINEGIGNDNSKDHLNNCINHQEKAVDVQSDFADAYALLGSCFGMKATGMLSGMKYGPKSNSAIEKAKNIESDNPRIFLIDGIGNIYKPSMFGGGTGPAIEALNRAAELFESYEPKSELAPDWGHAEVYAWLGQAYEKDGNTEQARKAYQNALDVDPNYGWVKHELLPALAKN